MTYDELSFLLKNPLDLALTLNKAIARVGVSTMTIAELEASLELIEAKTMFTVTGQTNGDGKPLYTNDNQRKAAVVLEMNANAEVEHIEELIHAARLERAEAEGDAAALKALVRLTTSTEERP